MNLAEGTLRIEADGNSEEECRRRATEIADKFFGGYDYRLWMEDAITRTIRTGDNSVVSVHFDATYRARRS